MRSATETAVEFLATVEREAGGGELAGLGPGFPPGWDEVWEAALEAGAAAASAAAVEAASRLGAGLRTRALAGVAAGALAVRDRLTDEQLSLLCAPLAGG
jgi:hypothetical protein